MADSADAHLEDDVYARLRALANKYLGLERAGHTLQPTALVHEAYLRLADQDGSAIEDRAHFCAIAAIQMRRVLADHARRVRAQKRGGEWGRVTLAGVAEKSADVDIVALDDALEKLSRIDERQSRVVELRFLGGLTVEDVATALDVSRSTVEAEWRMARAWLITELRKADR